MMMEEIIDHRHTSDTIVKSDSNYIPHKTRATKG